MLLHHRRLRNRKSVGCEPLEARQLLTSNILITEFVASNDTGMEDVDGETSDWLELSNSTKEAIDLDGWHLTDDASSLAKWTLPPTKIQPGDHIVVFASGKDRANSGAELHTNFKLSAGGEFLAIVEPDGRTISHKYDLYPPQLPDVSYGLSSDLVSARFFTTPTPGIKNDDATQAPSAAVSYSVTGRTFVDPFELALRTTTTNVDIRYTLDGAIPDETSELYEDPIRITTSTRLRARAFEPGKSAGPVNSQSYIAVGSSLTDFEDNGVFESNLPLMVFQSFGGQVDANASRLVPVSAVLIDNVDGAAGLLDEPDFAGRAGLRIRGQSSQGWPKKQYALEFWEEGNSDERTISAGSAEDRAVSVFGLPAESDWVLNGPYADKTQLNNYLTFGWSRAMGQYAPRTKLVEVFVKQNNGALNYRTDYRGTYVLLEKIKVDSARVDIQPLSPAATSEPEISGGYIWKFDKNGTGDVNFTSSFQSRTGSGRPWKFVEPQRPPRVQRDWLANHLTEFESALYGADFADPVNGYAKYIDVDSWIDTWLLVEFTKNIDGFRLSTYYHKDVNGKIKQGPTWDFNLSLANANYLAGAFPAGWYHDGLSRGDYPYWDRLFDDPNFELQVRDRWFELRNSIFSTESLMGDVDEAVALLSNGNPHLDEIAAGERSNPISRNFDRWGTLDRYLWPNCFFGTGGCPPSPLPNRGAPDSYGDYIFILRDFIERRAAWIDSEFGSSPTISPPGGVVAQDIVVRIAAPTSGTVYYTLDGSDPRDSATGGIASQAIEFNGDFTLASNAQVTARTLRDSVWSAKATATYFVQIPTISLSEIHYNPGSPTSAEQAAGFTDGNDFEFVELLNFGEKSVDLSGMQFVKGIQAVFGKAQLGPGQRIVVPRNTDAFRFRYGNDARIVSQFGSDDADADSKLQNSGEQVVLIGPLGEPIVDLTYSDSWYPESDGVGFSLVRRDPIDGSPANDETAWRLSEFLDGSPGAAEAGVVPGPGDLVLNEITSSHGGSTRDVVELRNTTGHPISVGGYYLSDDTDNESKYRIPVGTEIAAGGYLILDRQLLGDAFQLSLGVAELSLRGALPDGTLIGFSETVEFGSVAADQSWGRFETSIGADFTLLQSPTPNAANALPQVGPLVINEMLYHPMSGGHEFIELLNISDQTISLADWGFDRGIRYRFPSHAEISPGGFVVLMQVVDAPSEAATQERIADFREAQQIPNEVFVFAYSDSDGSLNNRGETLTLTRPGETTGVRYLVDRIRYTDQAPWFPKADGLGPSLSRMNAVAYGNDPANWSTSTQGGSPGRNNVFEDITPPSTPQQLSLITLTGGDVGLAWLPAVDANSRVDHYDVYRDGQHVATSMIPFFRDSVDWTTGRTITYQVTAVNTDGYVSPKSNAADAVASEASFQQGIQDYNGATDARITERSVDTNDARGTRLAVDGNRVGASGSAFSSLLRWANLRIPAGTHVVGASVAINVVNSGDDFVIQPLLRDWNEQQVTWNQASAGESWQAPGAQGDIDAGPVIGSIEPSGRGLLTTQLNHAGVQWVDGWLQHPSSNYGLLFSDAANSIDNISFDSSESTSLDQRPTLTLWHAPRANTATGDLNLDGSLDAHDVDLLHAAIRNGIDDTFFDLDADGMVAESDVDHLLEDVVGAVRGDANLDGVVDFSDFLVLSAGFGNRAEQTWSRGDFDGDGQITHDDFQLLAANYGKQSALFNR